MCNEGQYGLETLVIAIFDPDHVPRLLIIGEILSLLHEHGIILECFTA
jgi:hypothetical protein